MNAGKCTAKVPTKQEHKEECCTKVIKEELREAEEAQKKAIDRVIAEEKQDEKFMEDCINKQLELQGVPLKPDAQGHLRPVNPVDPLTGEIRDRKY